MAARNIIRIYRKQNTWLVVQEGKIVCEFETRDEAEKFGRTMIDKKISSEILFFRPGGSVESRLSNFG
ncbi:MAG: hypothetical protein EH225_06335 [Calditrichaeota bacterium]|nr:hypothetical protein [Calditrichota bacterium]RQW04019.1 MAG: hypothetical protein EH225_06335 [Calditrichota bacterium]